MDYIRRYKLNDIRVDIDPGDGESDAIYAVTAPIAAYIEDLEEEAIVQEVIQTAQKAGIAYLWLLDKKFVLDALREKMEREDPKPLTFEELRQMDGQPVWLDAAGGVYGLVDTPDRCVWLDRGGCFAIGNLDGKAYRHKPKEE